MAKLPKHFTDFVEQYPEVGKAYTDLGKAAASAGPLDKKTQLLIKVGIALGAGLEGATHSGARKAVEAGATPDELRQTAILAVTTIGWPSMMRGLAWIDDVIGEKR
ncbi:MAG TPA: carboxymuconolactone decarboxylase family protein [Fimbriimonadaceae bacterium]|nr:carboxymuconolactone decarboxylase family protein [Fimbriimonadaceae bacterium]